MYDEEGRLAAEYATGAPAAPCTTCDLAVDHLGSTRLVVDGNGNTVGCHDYLPFGEEISQGVGGRGACYGASDTVNQKFTSKERDGETAGSAMQGLDYFGARYFSGAEARFMGADAPFADQSADDPQSWNMYSYVRNSPIDSVDPDGRFLFKPASPKGCINGRDENGNPCFSAQGIAVNQGWLDYMHSLSIQALTISLQAQQTVRGLLELERDFLSRPRDGGCLNAATAAGASGGAAVGMLGVVGGPAVGVTEPTAIFAGGGLGWWGGMIMCSSGTWGGSGGGRGGDYREKTKGAQGREQKNLNDIARKHGIDRHAFGDFVEEEKAIEGRGSSTEYGYRELENLVEKYKAAGGK